MEPHSAVVEERHRGWQENLQRGWSWPFFCLCGIGVWRFVTLHRGHLLSAIWVEDTNGYWNLSRVDTLAGLLSGNRTYGWPFFLKVGGKFFEGFEWVPTAHLLVFLAMVLLFWRALREFTGRPWLALAAAVPLFFTPLLEVIPRLQADSLAGAMGLGSASLLLLLACRPKNRWLWVALGLFVFYTYQARPAYLYLVILVPLMGPLLRLCLGPVAKKDLGRWAATLAALCLVPWLAFCTLRWVVVDHFGLVSFGGYNMIGVAASFLDPELIEQLPEAHRPLAQEILKEREARNLIPFRQDGQTGKWYDQYNINIWQIAIPTVRRLADEVVQQAEVNTQLVALSKELIRLRPRLAVKWMLDTFVNGAIQGVSNRLTVWLTVLTIIAAPLAFWRHRYGGSEGGELEAAHLALQVDSEAESWWRIFGFWILGLVYFFGGLALVAAVQIPIPRYIDAISLLLPSALSLTLFQLWTPKGRSIQMKLRSAIPRLSGS